GKKEGRRLAAMLLGEQEGSDQGHVISRQFLARLPSGTSRIAPDRQMPARWAGSRLQAPKWRRGRLMQPEGVAVPRRVGPERAGELGFGASVERSEVGNTSTGTRLGVSDLSRLRRAACALRSRGPEQNSLRREFTSAWRSDARCGLRLALVCRSDRSAQRDW